MTDNSLICLLRNHLRPRRPGTCHSRARLHRVGSATFAAVYARDATRCVPAPFPPQSLFRLGPEIPPTDFAALKLTPP
jgi:hypothetical protein